jgi:Na+-transporting methylmalonyl-CoA/oxaloacetate decarboxylase gamma subunit
MPLVLIFLVLAAFMTWRIGRLVVAKVRKARSDAQFAKLNAKKAKRLSRAGAVKRLKAEQCLLRAPVPVEKDADAPESLLGAIAAGFFDALPHLLIVLYGVSPTAYNKVRRHRRCMCMCMCRPRAEY